MSLPGSGAISMGQVNTELGFSPTALISLNDTVVRDLFNIHPEESIFDIERAVVGCSSTAGEQELIAKIEKAVKKTGAELVGVDAKGMAFAVCSAMVGA